MWWPEDPSDIERGYTTNTTTPFDQIKSSWDIAIQFLELKKIGGKGINAQAPETGY
jgi:hypothetical protein